MVPYENSTYGSVIETRDLFANQQHRFPHVTICLETYLGVSHYLLGRHITAPRRSIPIVPGHIKCLYSHPAAFGQCKLFLAQYMKGVECLEVSSTSKAAEMVSQDLTNTSAAIASKTAAKLYGLDFLAEEIQDCSNNTTRFLFLRHQTDADIRLGREISSPVHQMKTLITFTVMGGRLSDALRVFITQNLNLTNFYSVPRAANTDPWQYTFFAEFGQKQEPNGVGKVKQTLAQLEAVTEFCKWHGSWPSEM